MNPSVVARFVGSGFARDGRLGRGRRDRAARRGHLRGTRGAAAARRRPLRLLARRVSSGARVHLRLDAPARFAERRHGGGGGHVRELFRSTARFARCRFALSRPLRSRVFTAINALGVRTGTTTQNAFMVLKIVGHRRFCRDRPFRASASVAEAAAVIPAGAASACIGLAMVPVLFAYSGWQTSSFMTAELREPHATLPRGLIAGVVLVVRALSRRQRCLPARARHPGARAHEHAGIGRRRARLRPGRPRRYGGRHRDLDARIFEQPDSDVAARLLSDGRRRHVLQAARVGQCRERTRRSWRFSCKARSQSSSRYF